MNAVRGLVRADSARIALVDEAGRLVVRYSTAFSSMMPPGLRDREGPGRGRPRLVHRPAGAHRRLRQRSALPGQPLPADRPRRRHRVLHDGADRLLGRGGGRDLRQQLHAPARSPTCEEAALVTLADHAAVAVEKARLLAAEHAARAEAESASRGKDELLAMLGHELRNPLSAIATAIHVLETGEPSAELTRRAHEIIARQNAHLAHLVDDLLDVARVTSGKIALVRAAARARPGGAPQPGHPGRERPDRAAPRHPGPRAGLGRRGRDALRADRQQPASATRSASRPRPAPSRSACAARRATRCCASATPGWGSRRDMLPRVFDLFVQGERGPDRGAGGLGLGLTLVRRITELHGGRVDAASAGAGHGSTFTVRLPALAAPPAAARAGGAAAPSNGAAPPHSRRGGQRGRARDAPAPARAWPVTRSHEAADGPGGLEAALRLRPDIALVDVGLPGFDGYQLARRVRGERRPVHLPGGAHRLRAARRPPPGHGGGLRRAPGQAGESGRPAGRHSDRRAYRPSHGAPGDADMPITVTRLSPCFAARIDGADIRRPARRRHVGGHPRRLRRALGAALPRRRRSTTRRRSPSACASARSRSPAA